jgi:hypothetical protein
MTQPRRWFQLHLSTVVVLTLVAGGLVGLNVTPRESKIYVRQSVLQIEEWQSTNPNPLIVSSYGWPTDHRDRALNFYRVSERDKIRYDRLCANVAVCLAIMSAVGVTLEYLIRRRKPQT